MTLPGQSFSFPDGGLGLVEQAPNIPLYVGGSTGGTQAVDTIEIYTKPADIVAGCGRGEVVEAASQKLVIAGGSVAILRTATSVAAANGAVTATRVGTSTGTITLAGTPTDHLQAVVRILTSGGLGAGEFDYSLDGGKNRSEAITIPAGGAFVIPDTGVTATFVEGVGPDFFEDGDSHAWTSTAATYNGTDITTAWTALLNSDETFSYAVFTGYSATATAAATLASTIDTLLTNAANSLIFLRGMMSAGAEDEDAVNTAFAAFADVRVGVVHSRARNPTAVPIVGRGNPLVPFVNIVAARAAGVKLSTNVGWVGFGSLNATEPEFDERKHGEVLFNKKIMAPTTHVGRGKLLYVTSGLLKSPSGSDYRFWAWGRITDRIAQVVKNAEDPYINQELAALTDGTGRIDPVEAHGINTDVRGQLDAAIMQPISDTGRPGFVSGYEYAVDETNDFLATGIIQSTTRWVPKGVAERIVNTIGMARELAA